MAKVKIKLFSYNYVGAQVIVDGEIVRFRKSKDKNDPSGTLVGDVEVAKREVSFQVCNWFDLERRGWFFYAAFFWLIGVCGLFSPRFEKRCDKLNYATTLSLMEHKDDSLIAIKFLSPYKKGYAMELTSNFTTTLDNETNVYTRCVVAEKRRKVVVWLSFFATLIAAIILPIIIINGLV